MDAIAWSVTRGEKLVMNAMSVGRDLGCEKVRYLMLVSMWRSCLVDGKMRKMWCLQGDMYGGRKRRRDVLRDRVSGVVSPVAAVIVTGEQTERGHHATGAVLSNSVSLTCWYGEKNMLTLPLLQ